MCPHCGHIHVRRSHRKGFEYVQSWIRPGHYPYRCRNCQTRFWASRQEVADAIAKGETRTPDTIPPIAMEPPVTSESKNSSRSWRRFKRFIWRKTSMDIGTFILLIFIGSMVLAGVWWALKQFN